MKNHFELVAGAIALILLIIGDGDALPRPPAESQIIKQSGIRRYTPSEMQNLLKSNSVFLEETISSSGEVHFQLRNISIGFYPLDTAFTTSQIRRIFVDSNATVTLSLFKCGLAYSLGNFMEKYMHFNTDTLALLEKRDCDTQWNKNNLKLMIIATNGDAEGYVKIDGEDPDVEIKLDVETTINYDRLGVIILGTVLIVLIIILIACNIKHCCRDNQGDTPNLSTHSTYFHASYPHPNEFPLGVFPRRSDSEATVFEHEREEIEMARHQENYMLHFYEEENEDAELDHFSSDDSGLATSFNTTTEVQEE